MLQNITSIMQYDNRWKIVWKDNLKNKDKLTRIITHHQWEQTSNQKFYDLNNILYRMLRKTPTVKNELGM